VLFLETSDLPFSKLKNKLLMADIVEEFNTYRQRMNEAILAEDNIVMKRIFNLDTNAFMEGAIPSRTKEMLGLVASMVLRCDDCVKYHLGKCHEQGLSTAEVMEVFSMANLIGGTIVIPHTRRALEYWNELNRQHEG